ncbi:hypothetical protein JOQ06_025078 [Pogonophryne albipinna]|uniref:Fibronectin type-III domain-containing protein n=1 Tax=Pogonophryne albipinna TaxID=1090488 RepID=A0AAD6FEK2_9TELE|nr:hypothetical protein JOQ06_025078 [Pogonophryne albipinna]
MKCLKLLFLCWISSILTVTSCIGVQPTPPHKPEVQGTPENFNITWISGYEDHMYLNTALDFELLLQRSQSTESKEWLSPKGKYVLAYKTEEILTTDDVIVVPKPITKEPEENVDYHNPTVHLTFTQGHSSYVGLPGVHEASPPLTMIYPGDTSYTQLPSSVWGLGVGEKEVASSPPEDFLNISCADSGCEDPTQSPECSLPNSPVEDIPPPCYCNDYCILNKTAEGFAPVLVSR